MNLLNFENSFDYSYEDVLDKKPGLDIKNFTNLNTMQLSISPDLDTNISQQYVQREYVNIFSLNICHIKF